MITATISRNIIDNKIRYFLFMPLKIIIRFVRLRYRPLFLALA
jgi:hypothetical protein